MDPFLIKAIQLFLSLSILIVLHELGHFIPAKIFKVKVEKFYLFFDVKFALFKKKIGDTEYGMGWLPLGGYVKIAGMIDESMDKEQMALPPKEWEFRSKPAWQRLIIMLGGVTVNLILGFVIYMMILFVWGSGYISPENMPSGFAVADTFKEYGFQDGDRVLEVNGKEFKNSLEINKHLFMRDVETVTVLHQNGEEEVISVPENVGELMFQEGVYQPFVPIQRPVLDTVLADSPAALAGLQAGDSIVSVNDIQIGYWHEFTREVTSNKEKAIQVVVKRDGKFQGIPVDPEEAELAEDGEYLAVSVDPETGRVTEGGEYQVISITPNEEGIVGVKQRRDITPEFETYTLSESISEGFSYGYWTLHDYVAQFKYVFTKKGATQVGGFGAIGGLFPDTWNWQGFWSTTALISIILAFMNILPIPALDGGHVTFLLYEMISGRKPNEKVMEYAQMVGFFILIALVLFANGNDLYRWLFE